MESIQELLKARQREQSDLADLEDLDALFSAPPPYELLGLILYSRWTLSITPQEQSLLISWLGLEPQIYNEGLASELGTQIQKGLNSQLTFYLAWQFVNDCIRYLPLAEQSQLAKALFFNGFQRQIKGV